jgi:hypothetical protein
MDERQGLTDLDRALADALDVDVSPDFAARVRRRIATDAAPSRVRWRWQFAAAAAIVIAASALAFLPTRHPATPAAQSAQSQPEGSVPPPLDVHPTTDVRAHPSVADTRPALARVGLRVAAAAPSLSTAPEPQVLVPRREIEMYRRLIADAQQVPGALVVAAPPDIVAAGSITEIPIDPIKIDLIVPSGDGEGDRQ